MKVDPKFIDKSILMREWHPDTTVEHNDISYKVIDKSLNFAGTECKHIASVGAKKDSRREITVFDADRIKYKKFLPNEELEAEVLLSYIFNTLVRKLRKGTGAVVDELDDFVQNCAAEQGQMPPVIRFTDLLEKQLLVCRHRALLVGAVLGYMVTNGHLNPGSVRQYRTRLCESKGSPVDGGHAWIVYSDHKTGKKHIVDLMWEDMLDLSDKEELNIAKKKYGKLVIKHMITDIDRQDALEKAKDPSGRIISPPKLSEKERKHLLAGKARRETPMDELLRRHQVEMKNDAAMHCPGNVLQCLKAAEKKKKAKKASRPANILEWLKGAEEEKKAAKIEKSSFVFLDYAPKMDRNKASIYDKEQGVFVQGSRFYDAQSHREVVFPVEWEDKKAAEMKEAGWLAGYFS